jgi:glycosyltransferase involved in cell wall biosynthesis
MDENITDSLTLLCLCHLNWHHVWQRPQQLMSRFARYARVIYVDPPEIREDATEPHLARWESGSAVELLHPIFPGALIDDEEGPGSDRFTASYEALWLQLLPGALREAGQNTILWVQSPLADYLVAEARPQVSLAVYDCMDELANFRFSPPGMKERERNLLDLVDLVFTGGYSMYEVRKDRHPRVHCFPSGVDIDHYRKVYDPATEIPEPVVGIPSPRLGYFGVLDERIDWPLIAGVAQQRPDWHWLLVGPIAKVNPAELPQAPNIHYLGQQAYEDLPAFLKSFDIATMPFALNEATRFISPTKTPEYLAGGRPVISTSVRDVVSLYEGIVTIADGVDEWLAAVPQVLEAPPEVRKAWFDRATPILERSQWDSTVEHMWALMMERLGRA